MAGQIYGHTWKVFSIGYPLLLNNFSVSQYITLIWPLPGILNLAETPQSPRVREIV